MHMSVIPTKEPLIEAVHLIIDLLLQGQAQAI